MPNGMTLEWLRHPSLPVKAGLLCVAPLLLLAFVLSKGVGGAVESRSVEAAKRQARTVTGLLGQRRLAALALDGVSSSERRRLDRELSPVLGKGVANLRLLDLRGRVVYASEAGAIGGLERSSLLPGALEGRAMAKASSGAHDIEAFVPLRMRASGTPTGALALDVPASIAAGSLFGKVRTLQLVLLLGVSLLFAGILYVLAIVSSRLTARATESERRSQRDALTGLPNRALFNQFLEQALKRGTSEGQVAVLLMDLDRFKEINDTLGHFNGDQVLVRVADRLRTALRDGDTVARLGGDEFAVLLPNVQSKDAVRTAVNRIDRALEEHFTAGGLALKVEASIGIALHPDDGESAGKLLRAADVAMYAAKKAHTGHAFYSPDQQQYSPERLGLVAQLSRAMEHNELVLHYQPKARLDSGAVDSVEALARWEHPQLGLLRPDEFIPVTEHTQMIRPITVHLLEVALDQVRTWRAQGLHLSVAVNLSTQILLDLELPGEIGRMLSRLSAAPDLLEVEITESAIMYDPRRAKKVLEGLHEMGLRIAVDDFGTGYSSLVSLRHLPVNALKIDKSFVMGMADDESDAAIVKSCAQLGRNLGLDVIAEGVETQAAWRELAALGCDYAQGYYLSKPLAGDQFARWLDAYREMFGAPVAAPREESSRGWSPGRPAAALGSRPA